MNIDATKIDFNNKFTHVPISILCFPGIIGGGGIPGFFLRVEETRVCDDFTGWDAIVAHVIFFGLSAVSFDAVDDVFDWLFVFAGYESRFSSNPMRCTPCSID